jgi:magnesium transporter
VATQNVLLPLVQKHFEQDLVGAVHILETIDENEAMEVLRALPIEMTVNAIKHFQVSYAAALLADADGEMFQSIVSSLDPKHAASIFMHLPRDARERLMEHIPEKQKAELREALTYPEDSVGRLMSTDFLSFDKNMRVGVVIERIRELTKKRMPASYAYVVDGEGHLDGVINMRDLMLASGDETLEKVMRTGLFSLHCFTDREQAASEISKRKFFAAPVVDGQNHILGIIRAEQLLQGIREEVSEDLQKMFGAGGDERTFSPVGFSIRKRLPWLNVNLATAFLAASVVSLFEDVIARVTILAVFLPVIAGQGGNAGAQSLAVVIRGIVLREIPRGKLRKLVIKEGLLGAINGLAIGIITALVAMLWTRNPYMGLVIGLGMLVNMIVAGISGASIPILMKAVGFDPAQCSSIILTTVTDVMGFLAFLGFAVLFQAKLV